MSVDTVMVGLNHRFKHYVFPGNSGLIRLQSRRRWPLNRLLGEWKTLNEVELKVNEEVEHYGLEGHLEGALALATNRMALVCTKDGAWYHYRYGRPLLLSGRFFQDGTISPFEINEIGTDPIEWPMVKRLDVLDHNVRIFSKPDTGEVIVISQSKEQAKWDLVDALVGDPTDVIPIRIPQTTETLYLSLTHMDKADGDSEYD